MRVKDLSESRRDQAGSATRLGLPLACKKPTTFEVRQAGGVPTTDVNTSDVNTSAATTRNLRGRVRAARGSLRHRRPLILGVAVLTFILAGSACSGPGALFTDRDREQEKQSANVTMVQSEVMSFADNFISAISQAWNRVASDARAADPEGFATLDGDQALPSRQRRAALHNKLANASSALAIATCPNPFVGVADMITMVTLQRMVLESPQSQEFYGPKNGAALVEAYREQEARAWRMAEQTMTPPQREDLARLIAEWRANHPNDTYVANVRLEDFSSARQQTVTAPKDNKSPGSLLALVWLDPLAGLDPAEREVHKTRLLGERMFFYASRSPQILKWQVETLYQDLLAAPEFKQTLASAEQATNAVDRISGVAEKLPTDVANEREAALNQFFAQLAEERQRTIDQLNQSVTEQRQALVAQLEESQGKLQESLREFQAAAETTNKMADSVTTAINAADHFAARFDSDPNEPPSNSDPLGDYKAAAAQTADAADRLTTLAKNLDGLLNSPTIPGHTDTLRSVVLDVNNNAKNVISFAFWRLLILCIVAPFAITLAALLYRWVVRGDAARRTDAARA